MKTKNPMDLVRVIFLALLGSSMLTLCIPIFALSYLVAERERVEALDGALRQAEVASMTLSYVSAQNHSEALLALMESTGVMIELSDKEEAYVPLESRVEQRLRSVRNVQGVLASKRGDISGLWVGYDLNETVRLWSYAPVSFTHPSIFQTSALIVWTSLIIALLACYPLAKILSKDFGRIARVAKFIEYKNTSKVSHGAAFERWQKAFTDWKQRQGLEAQDTDILQSAIVQKQVHEPCEKKQENECQQEPCEAVQPLCHEQFNFLSKEGYMVGRVLERISERLDDAQALRALNLAALAHDLKGPIARVRLAAEVESEERLREMAEKQMDLMNDLISDFVLWAKNEAATIEPFEFKSVLPRVLDLVSKSTTVQVSVDKKDGFILGNQALLERALMNIVDNHFKYGKGLHAFVVQYHKAQKQLNIDITDASGSEGIDAQQMMRLCAPFERADSARSVAGTGLGLAIAKQGIETCGGSLTFVRTMYGMKAQLMIPVIS